MLRDQAPKYFFLELPLRVLVELSGESNVC